MENKTKEFAEALGELEAMVAYHTSNDCNSWDELGAARAKVIAAYQSNIIVQTDDALIECYRLAVTNDASDQQLTCILNLIAKEKGIRV